jgi:hypothetical protein
MKEWIAKIRSKSYWRSCSRFLWSPTEK